MQGRNTIGVRRVLCAFLLFSFGVWNCGAQAFTNASEQVFGLETILGNPVYTNGQVQFQMAGGLQGVAYSFQSSTDLVNWTTIATNLYPSVPTDYHHPFVPIINIPAPGAPCFYRLNRSPIPLGVYAVGAVTNITFFGNGVSTTSFNSSDPNESTNGLYNGYAGTNGNVASEDGLVSLGYHTVQGSLYLGPLAAYDENGTITGQVYLDANVQFPDVVIPSVAWQTAPVSNTTHDFTSANNNGYYTVSDSDSIIVEAGVTVILQVTTYNFAPASITINGGTTNSGTLIVYQTSGGAAFAGNASGGPIGNRARNFIYLGAPNVESVTIFSQSSPFVGVIYAPEAIFVYNGGGSSSFIGSCTVNNLTANGSFVFIHDDDLLTSGPFY